jgi:uncharacterized protein
MKNRILGFDLARAYAIFGMFIVNFNIVFGSHKDESWLGQFLNLFNGNSSSTFVILAGMGVALMSNRAEYSREEKQKLKSIVIKRSWFLFAAGLLLYNWWSADILHFYGGYLHIAAFMLFVPKRFYLWAAGAAILIFHVLLAVIPYENGWNFDALQYTDFWTVQGFLRNTFYNGWNPIFPWMAYFLLGMWLGRLDWQNKRIKQNVFLTGAIVWTLVETLQLFAGRGYFGEDLAFYITADYIPPFLPFLLGTSGFALMILVLCLSVGDRFAENEWMKTFAKTGQMTLTHYVVHLTLGMVMFGVLTGKTQVNSLNAGNPITPLIVLLFAAGFFAASVIFSRIWSRKFKNGPLETLMRIITG